MLRPMTVGENGYIYVSGLLYHRWVWEHKVGPIPKGYQIHHIDGDKTNNAINNLACMSKHDHMSLHSKGINNPWYGKNKGKDNGFYGKHHTIESNEKNRLSHIGKKLPKFICEFCGKTTSSKRWHGKNCRNRGV